MLGRRSLDDLIGRLDKIQNEVGEIIEVFRPIWTVGEYDKEGSFELVRLTNIFGRPKYVPIEMVQFRRGDSREKALHHYQSAEFVGKKLYKTRK